MDSPLRDMSLQKESEWEKTKKEFLKELKQALQNNIPHAVNTEFSKFLPAVETAIDTIVSEREKEIAEEVKKKIKIMDEKVSLRNEWNLALLRYAEKVGTEDAPESRRKIVTDISQAIATAVANREKEIAEEVEEIQTKLHNGHLEAGYKLTNKLLSILKH